jgi:hypothetical protein
LNADYAYGSNPPYPANVGDIRSERGSMKLSDIRALSDRARKFEDLLAEVFRLEGFDVNTQVSGSNVVYAADLVITSKKGTNAIVEAKLYASRAMPMSAIMDGIKVADAVRRTLRMPKAIFAAAIQISEVVRQEADRLYPAVSIYDLNALTFLFNKYPRLQGRFEELIRESMTFSDAPVAKPTRIDVSSDVDKMSADTDKIFADTDKISADTEEAPPGQSEIARGEQLCVQLHDLASGTGHAKLFENVMIDSLKYIFERELVAWSPQKKANRAGSGNLNRAISGVSA